MYEKSVDVLISVCKLYFVEISVFGTLYVTYPVLSSNIDELYDVILPVFFISVKSYPRSEIDYVQSVGYCHL